jgi:hypothetical protein
MGYTLGEGARIPYFGLWVHKDTLNFEQEEYVVGPNKGGMCVNGDPALLGNHKHQADSPLWAGALVNQANQPAERNCIIRSVPKRAWYAQRASYLKQCKHAVRCAIETTRVVQAGEELLVNYSWSVEYQMERRCGYDYYAEKVIQLPRGREPIQDIDTNVTVLSEGWGEEEVDGTASSSSKI